MCWLPKTDYEPEDTAVPNRTKVATITARCVEFPEIASSLFRRLRHERSLRTCYPSLQNGRAIAPPSGMRQLALHHLLPMLCLIHASSAGCGRPPRQSDAGGPDSDASVVACDPDAGPPEAAWQPASPASVTPPSQSSWVAVSSDAECAGLTPHGLPPRLSWTAPSKSWCDHAFVDGQGDIAIPILEGPLSYFRSDGSAGMALQEDVIAPLKQGFWTFIGSDCSGNYYEGMVGPDGHSIGTRKYEGGGGGFLSTNPRGGFVQSKFVMDLPSRSETLEVRWVREDLEPISQWQFVMKWSLDSAINADLEVFVDDQGKALVLSFLSPMSAGSPLPPSTWKSAARWMTQEGPLGDPFEPRLPEWVVNGNAIAFLWWGRLLPIPGGGLAAFREPESFWEGTVSPSGWYAFYPSGEQRVAAPPAWLQSHNGSVQFVAERRAFVATSREAGSCARTALLMAPSGRTCFTASLEGSDLCEASDTIWPDGTLVLQNGCEVRWWPGLAR